MPNTPKELRKIKYQDDISIHYHCGCSESRLEAPEYWEKLCENHKEKQAPKEDKEFSKVNYAITPPSPHEFEPLENGIQCKICFLMKGADCHTPKEDKDSWEIELGKIATDIVLSLEGNIPRIMRIAKVKTRLKDILSSQKALSKAEGRAEVIKEIEDWANGQKNNPLNAIMTEVREGENRTLNKLKTYLSSLKAKEK